MYFLLGYFGKAEVPQPVLGTGVRAEWTNARALGKVDLPSKEGFCLSGF